MSAVEGGDALGVVAAARDAQDAVDAALVAAEAARCARNASVVALAESGWSAGRIAAAVDRPGLSKSNVVLVLRLDAAARRVVG